MNAAQLEALNEIMQTCADVRKDNIEKVTVTTTKQNGKPQKKELSKEEWLVDFFEHIENLIGENFDIMLKD